MEDCGARTMGYVTTCLYKVKVNNGTSNAVGEARTTPGSTRVTFRISATSLISILLVGLGWHSCVYVYAQVKPNSSSKVRGGGSYASCYDNESGKLVGTDKRRTFVLKTPDGKYRAYAETEAVTHKRKNAQGDEEVECENKTGLFVAGPQNQKFRQVMSVLPRPNLSGNSISLVDWSREGHQLLIGEGLWGYGSDFGGTVIRVYDADSRTLSSESLVEEAFRKHVGKECIGVYQPVGFSEDGGIIIKAGPYFDEGEEQPRPESCMAREGIWLIGPAHDAIRLLPDDYMPKHYGKEEPRKPAP
jgi:hypothetical protein